MEYIDNMDIGLSDEIADLKAVQKKHEEIIEELSDMLDHAGREIAELRRYIKQLEWIVIIMASVGGFAGILALLIR